MNNQAAAASPDALNEDLAVLCLGTVCLAPRGVSASGAVVVPRSQNRSITIQLGVPGADPVLTNRLAAAGFGVFNQGNSAAGVVRRRHHYMVQSNQTSEIGTTTIAASGQVTVVPTKYFYASARSDFAVAFALTQQVAFKLAGNLTWKEADPLPDNSPSPGVTLVGPGGVVYSTPPASPTNEPLDYSSSGILPVGDYVLEAHAGEVKSAGIASGIQSYTVFLTVAQ